MKKFLIRTFGCQMNKSDSERIAAVLLKSLMSQAQSIDEADLLVINTCSVRDRAEERLYGMADRVLAAKGKNPQLKVVVTGCMARRERRGPGGGDGGVDIARASWVDEILDIRDIARLPDIVGLDSNIKGACKDYLRINPIYSSQFQAFVPIATGCNNFCSYCVVPFTRGEEKYRGYGEIISEVSQLLSNGYKQITLLGQNVNSWKGERGTKGIGFPELLQDIAKLGGDDNRYWVRFLTSHPKDLSAELIDVIANEKNVTEYVHLPIQSGSDKILQLMNRNYSVAHYRGLVSMIRDRIENVAVSTDIIVGFPGETESSFNETIQTLERLEFDMLYVAMYSAREGTAAAKLEDSVSSSEKKRRQRKVLDLLEKTSLQKNSSLVGQELEVLVVKEGLGQTRTMKDVIIPRDLKVGQFYTVKITKALSNGLQAVKA